MSDSTTEKNSFEDYYKIDNLDDSELQARLYAEIYYDSNIEGESRTTDILTIQDFDSMATQANVDLERLQHESEEQPSTSETAEAGSQKMLSTNQIEFTQVNTLAGREMNPMTYACDNESPEDPLATQRKENKRNSKKCKSSKHQESSEKDDTAYSKYNVVSKCVKNQRLLAKQTDKDKDKSDSEESIFEVPIPPKPKPPLIDLQDSDEESNSGIDKDDLILKKWGNTAIKTYSKITSCRNSFKELKTSNQIISSKSKNTDKSYNNIVNSDKSIQICLQRVTEDIVLNCTTIQRGAESVNEIKQMSKSVEANQRNKSIEDTNQNCKKKSLRNESRGNNENNANPEQEVSVILERKSQMRTQQNVNKSRYNLRCRDKISEIESRNPVMDNRKRQCNNDDDSYPKQKRQCTIERNTQDVMSQGNNDEERRNASCHEYFKQMSEEMQNYYNSNRGQENFDVGELQRNMSKDPRMWAILNEDIMACSSSKQRIRFWNVRCTNCHRDGHQRYDCSSRNASSCYMCGTKGHTKSQCPQKMCLTCGHELEQCPDLWRRYHQTTDMNSAPQDPGNVMKPTRLLYCCNCAKRGHESSTCREYGWPEHFPTPVTVTNYTDGPTYTSYAPSSSEPNPESDFLSSETKTASPQNATNIQHEMVEDMEPSVNVNTLSSSVNFSTIECVPSTSQEVVCKSQMETSLKSSPTVDKIWSTVKTNFRQTKVNHVTFTNITYYCGYFHHKNHKDARMILENLTTFFTHRKSTLNSLINRKVIPVFLNTLLEKEIQFKVTIGFTQRRILSLQLLAMKEYIEYLYDLLHYWLNLPDEEKDYGIDVNLPINPIKMFNVLSTRIPQLEKMRFTCYAEHIGGTNDPRLIYNSIKNDKAILKKFAGNKKTYNRLRRKLWRSQTKLLMIINTEPEPNVFVCTYRDVMRRFDSERCRMGEKLDIATYLRLILLYNQLFVPHTSEDMHKTFHRIELEENKNKNNSLQIQQESETVTVREQENLKYNIDASSTSTYTSQNIKFKTSCVINNQNNEMLVEGQNMDNVPLDTSKTTYRNCDEIIKDSLTQDSQIIMPSKIESAESGNFGRNEGQLSTSKVESNVSANKQNINVNNTVYIPPLSKKKTKKQNKRRLREFKKLHMLENMYDIALSLVKQARTFELLHMMNAADETQRHINNQTLKLKHVKALSKLILLEERYQKNVNTCCKNFK